MSTESGSCPCGKASFTISGDPLIRAFCHCLICQSFNEAPFADIVTFRTKDVQLDDPASTEFKVHRQPPLVHRGVCVHCRQPSIEKMTVPGVPKVTIVPVRNLKSVKLESAMHIFYHRRTEDVQDELPKYSGYLSSQARFSMALIKALWSG